MNEKSKCKSRARCFCEKPVRTKAVTGDLMGQGASIIKKLGGNCQGDG